MMAGQQNEPSVLLSQEENDLVFTIIGHRKQSKATAVVQMYHADRTQWTKFKTGVCCFVKDNVKKSYYIRLVDITTKSIAFEQEIYNQFTYKTDRTYFHSFPGDRFMIGLNFASDLEADKFSQAVNTKVQERSVRRMTMKKKREDGGHATVIGKPPVSPITDGNDPFSNFSKQGRPKRPRGKKITKSDIGLPSDFRHLSHVGFDPQTGAFDSSNIDPQWKKLLDTVGVTDEQLEDTNTANFIYDFVEKHGGIQEANRQLEAASKMGPPPPPSRHGPPPPSRSGPPIGRRGLPPPPPRESSHSGSKGSVPAPPPPPPVGAPAPPPPPPPPVAVGGGPPPPPSRTSPTSSLPPVSDGRSNLMASIRAGIQLRTVAEDEREVPSGAGEEDLEGMAGALARALAARSNAIQQSDTESEEDWQEEEDEWEDN